MDTTVRSSEERQKGYLWLLCGVCCLLGSVTGAVVFSRTFTDADVAAYIDSQRLLPISFSEGLIFSLRQEIFFLSAILLMAGFAFGWLVLPVLLVYRGLGIGLGACCLLDGYGLFGALYAVAVIVLPSAIALTAQTLACRDAISVSFGIFRFISGRNAGYSGILQLIAKVPLCAAVIVCAAALSAFLRMPLHTILC